MQLYARTPKRTLDRYDPKQRLVGGVMLGLIIILIYFILKGLISLSAVHDGRYRLASAREDEVLKNPAAVTEPTTRVVGNDGVNTITTLPKPLRPLPLGFTFLDLDGNPMGKEELDLSDQQEAQYKTKSGGAETGWIVQVLTVKTESAAKQWVDKLKEKGFETTISKSNNRFVLTLSKAQPDKATAQKISKQLSADFKLKRIKIRENKPDKSATPEHKPAPAAPTASSPPTPAPKQ